jgi:hypothetical protein
MITADVWLGHGDAALVLRHDGKMEVKTLDWGFDGDNTMTCLGMMYALENVEWRQKLEARAREKWRAKNDG